MFNDAKKGTNMTTKAKAKSAPETLPPVGMSRWEQLRHFIPVSRETWRQLVLAGRAPQAHRLTERCTMYDNGAVHRWLAAPSDFRAEG